jgi:hypothetical protein
MSEIIKSLPLSFLPAKKEVQKLENTYWYNKQNEKQERNETDENLALLYLLLSDFASFAENKQYGIGDKLLEKKGNSNWEIILGEFGKKVVYSAESSWIEIQDMNKYDFEQYTVKINKEYKDKKGYK